MLCAFYFGFFFAKTAVVEPEGIIFAAKNTRVSFTFFPQRERPVHLGRRAMHGFDSELSLNLFIESQTADRDRLGPSIISPHQLTLKRLGDPFTVCLLKL